MASDRNTKNRENYEKLMKPHQEIQDIKQDMEAISKTVQSVSDSLDSFKALQEAENKAIHKKIDDTATQIKEDIGIKIGDAKNEFQEKLDEQQELNGETFKTLNDKINDKFDDLSKNHNAQITKLRTEYNDEIEKINQEYSKLSADTTKNAGDIKKLGNDYTQKLSNLEKKYDKNIADIKTNTEDKFNKFKAELKEQTKILKSLQAEVSGIKNKTLIDFTTKIKGLEAAISKFVSMEDINNAEEKIKKDYKEYLDLKSQNISTTIVNLNTNEIDEGNLTKLTQEITDLKTYQTTELSNFLDSIETKVDAKFKDSFEVFSKHISALSQHESKITKESIDVKFAVSSACSELLNNSFSKLSLYADSEDKQMLQKTINTLLSDFSKNYFEKIDNKVSDDLKHIKDADTNFFNAFNSHINSSTEQNKDEQTFEKAITNREGKTLVALEGLKSISDTDEFEILESKINEEIKNFTEKHKNEIDVFAAENNETLANLGQYTLKGFELSNLYHNGAYNSLISNLSNDLKDSNDGDQ